MSVTQPNVDQVRAHATRDLGITFIVEVRITATFNNFGNYVPSVRRHHRKDLAKEGPLIRARRPHNDHWGDRCCIRSDTHRICSKRIWNAATNKACEYRD
jgi:hypothetical protein